MGKASNSPARLSRGGTGEEPVMGQGAGSSQSSFIPRGAGGEWRLGQSPWREAASEASSSIPHVV